MSNLSANTTHCSNVVTDILVCNTGAVSVGMNIGTSVTPSMSGLSLSSNKLVITSGYSWLLECHMTIYSTNQGSYTAQWYNETTSAYVGQEAVCARHGSGLRYQLRQTRKVCRALILARDFGSNSSMTVYARVTAETGTANLSLSATYGEPCLKIVRIG